MASPPPSCADLSASTGNPPCTPSSQKKKSGSKGKAKKSRPNPQENEATRTESPDSGQQHQQLGRSSPRSRTKSPGVRFLHGRIYDSENGKTCHQCRQKTIDVSASCTNKNESKQCTINICHKCLLNRYGEKVEEVVLSGDWKCPRCRGTCNCSFCRKKRGQQPTGVLLYAAKASGFTSVSDLLHLNGDVDISSQKRKSKSNEDYTIASLLVSRGDSMQHNFDDIDNKRNNSSETGVLTKANDKKNVDKGNKEADALAESSFRERHITNESQQDDNTNQPSATSVCRSLEVCLTKEQCQPTEISENEKGSCHQCHTKITEPVPSCKNHFKEQCASTFCHKCLLNRYGEKVEQIVFKNWKCPKCRGLCSCSLCTVELGHKHAVGTVTGIRFHSESGERLDKGSKELSGRVTVPTEKATSEEPVASARICGIENGESDSLLCCIPLESNTHDDGSDISMMKIELNNVTEENSCPGYQISEKVMEEKEIHRRGEGGRLIKIESGTEDPVQNLPDSINEEETKIVVPDSVSLHVATAFGNRDKDSDVEFAMPQSIELNAIASIGLPAQDVGHALQFLEFCEAFGQVFNIEKGQPEYLLQDLACGEKRHTQDSAIVQFHVQLICMILQESGEEKTISLDPSSGNSWLPALKKCISRSRFASNELQTVFFDVNDDDYDSIDTSTKLRVLIFLCDEVLGTVTIRKWIDEQNSKFIERDKVEKEEALRMEKNLKRKLQDEVAKAMLARNGAPLSVSEYEEFISKVKLEAAHTATGTLEATCIGPKKKQRYDAVRSEPVLKDGKGRVFWRLAAQSGETEILLQEFEKCDPPSQKDRWFSYAIEQHAEVQRYIASIRDSGSS